MPLNDIKHLDMSINPLEVTKEALEIAHHMRPKWRGVEIKVKMFTDGLSNRLVGCHLIDNRDDMLLIRVFGEKTEQLVDREAELRNMRTMHRKGLGSAIYCTFNNGLCYEFAAGTVLTRDSIRDPVISSQVATMVAKMHSIKPDNNNDVKPCLFTLMRKFVDLVPDTSDRQRKGILSKTELTGEINFLEAQLSRLQLEVVFCHNDLLPKNIIKKKDGVQFIDFEYSDYNYQAFDIANHFCEFPGVEDHDLSLYPSEEFQMQWLAHYVKEWRNLSSPEGGHPSAHEQVVQLYGAVLKVSLAPHLLWGTWSLIQAANSSLDFDFLEYASLRFSGYFERKGKVFGA